MYTGRTARTSSSSSESYAAASAASGGKGFERRSGKAGDGDRGIKSDEGPGLSLSCGIDGSSTSAGRSKVRSPGEGDLSMVDAITSSAGASGGGTDGFAAVFEASGRTVPLPVPGIDLLGGMMYV
jgi:hypothetical protein